MANEEHLKILKRLVWVWNQWRRTHANIRPDLVSANLSYKDFSYVDLHYADLRRASLTHTDLRGANLMKSDLSNADLRKADLSEASLRCANLSHADLRGTNFSGADLRETNFSGALVGGNIFGDNDLSVVKQLDSVKHTSPSTIGLDTLYRSVGNIPEVFLRGCGVPDDFIAFIPSHFGIQQAIQFYSCFISYSTKDDEFARRLYSRLRDEKLRVWFAPEELKGGEKLHKQIEIAIQLHDRLLIVLSEHSMQSEWVMTEIRNARKAEIREKRRKLFPIRLVGFDAIREWECFDADTGKDLAIEAREYFIPDFSNWKDHNSFEAGFSRLLRDLKA